MYPKQLHIQVRHKNIIRTECTGYSNNLNLECWLGILLETILANDKTGPKKHRSL